MNYATIEVSGNTLRVTPENILTTGAVGGTVTLHFDESWSGFTKTLVWRGSGVTVDDIECTGRIPAQVLTKPNGSLILGIYGTKGETALPTLWADLGAIQPGTDPCGDESTDPTLPVWAQIPQYLESELQKAKDSGEFDGKPFTYEDFTDEQLEALKGEPGMVNLDDTKVGADGWSSKNIIDKLCPPFTKTGPVVTCQPMEGYPLCVTAQEGAAKITRCGKNLMTTDTVDTASTPSSKTLWSGSLKPPYVISGDFSQYNIGNQAGLVECVWGDGTKNSISCYMLRDGYLGTKTLTEIRYVHWDTGSGVAKLQLEVGAQKTDWEAYWGGKFAVGEPVPALAGVNTLWADTGDITVTGRADPLPLLQKLSSLSS